MRYSPETHQLPIGTQSFEVLRAENAVYVDKTKYIYSLITQARVSFLSRPRRFGKSLLISTLECVFRGKRALFVGTWIDQTDYNWPVHPVARIDMVEISKNNDFDQFRAALKHRIEEIAEEYGVGGLPLALDEASCFSYLIKKLAKIDKVVILIDEYDKPILDNLSNKPLAESIRNVLRQFYGIIKARDDDVQFVMMTGVTKFSKVSVFSGLNNLKDLTMTNQFAAICGYTQSELEQTFLPWVTRLAKANGTSEAVELKNIKSWYNGYQFSKAGESVYNPFSTLVLFADLEYEPYWYATGTPTFLISLIEKESFSPEEMESLEVSGNSLENHDVDRVGLVALLYQTGYLTIKGYDDVLRLYRLGYPNFEVKDAFNEILLLAFSQTNDRVQASLLRSLVDAIRDQDYPAMFKALDVFFATMPYELHQRSEKYYQSIFYMIFQMLNFRIGVEVSTNIGRVDAIIELEDRVLVFEFKIDQNADMALQQIHDKKYYQRYQHSGKEIVLFGVNFSTTERNIADWQQQIL